MPPQHLVNLYQVFDLNAGRTAGSIFTEYQHGPAIRSFRELLGGSKETLPARYPADFDLKCLGQQDVETGDIFPQTPETIYRGALFAEQAKQQ